MKVGSIVFISHTSISSTFTSRASSKRRFKSLRTDPSSFVLHLQHISHRPCSTGHSRLFCTRAAAATWSISCRLSFDYDYYYYRPLIAAFPSLRPNQKVDHEAWKDQQSLHVFWWYFIIWRTLQGWIVLIDGNFTWGRRISKYLEFWKESSHTFGAVVFWRPVKLTATHLRPWRWSSIWSGGLSGLYLIGGCVPYWKIDMETASTGGIPRRIPIWALP
jgi:hypothetical protein